MKNNIEKASLLEKILLGWAVWSFLAIIGKTIEPVLGSIIIYPILLFASLFGDNQALIIGAFTDLGISFGLIAGGLIHSSRIRRNKKNAVKTSV